MARMASVAATRLKADEAGTKRGAILDAAARVFLEQGYGAASMDAIAAEAGVSKQTVYSHFGAKEALFEAIVEVKCENLMAPVAPSVMLEGDHRDALSDVARLFLKIILAPPNTSLFRVVIAESARFPELAQAFYRAGPAAAVDDLADYLSQLNGRKILAVADPAASARLFFAMLRGDLYVRRLLDLVGEPGDDEIEAVVREAIAAFLAAHAP